MSDLNARQAVNWGERLVMVTFDTFDYFLRTISKMKKAYHNPDVIPAHLRDTPEGQRILKNLDGKVFRNEADWARMIKASGNIEESGKLTLQDKKTINDFLLLSKVYGVDVLVMSKPKDMAFILQKVNQGTPLEDLSEREKEALNVYAVRDDQGQYIEKKGAVTIVVKASDLNKVEAINNRIEEKRQSFQYKKEKAIALARKISEAHKKQRSIVDRER